MTFAVIQARWMRPAECASYIGKPAGRLKSLAKAGLLPNPSYHFGTKSPRYDREAIDEMIMGKQQKADINASVERIIANVTNCKRKTRRIHRNTQTR
jgi:hypothetical protein